MIKYQDLLKFEIQKFKEENKIEGNDEENIKKAIRKSLNDALSNISMRKKFSYSEKIDAVIEVMYQEFKDFSKFESIEDKFYSIVRVFETQLSNLYKGFTDSEKTGVGQKFVSMVFKYISCFDNVDQNIFKDCYLPLDKYTLNCWYKEYRRTLKEEDKLPIEINGEEINIDERLEKIRYAWTNIDKNLYLAIQKDIKTRIDNGNLIYEVNFLQETIKCKPTTRLELEFIVWAHEKNKQLLKAIENYKKRYKDFDVTIEIKRNR